MKSLLALFLAAALLAFTGNLLAEEKTYEPKENEVIYGEKNNSYTRYLLWTLRHDYRTGTW